MTGRFKRILSGAAVVALATATVPMVAHADPYAFASNQISGLTLTYADGTRITSTNGLQSATQQVSDSAQFAGFSADSHQGTGTVGSSLTIAQAYAGPGPAPTAGFDPIGSPPPGGFLGTRANSSIGAGSALSGGVPVNNVAEGYGTSQGNSSANNTATISFQVTGTGQGLLINFTDAINLMASTLTPAQSLTIGQTATASIANTFSVTALGASTPLDFYRPNALQAQVSSIDGVPFDNTDQSSALYTYTTLALTSGVVYNISLTSSSTESILPGTPVPEPSSLLLLGTGLIGLGFAARQRRRA